MVSDAMNADTGNYVVYSGHEASCHNNVACWVSAGILFVEDRTNVPKLVAIYAPGKWDSVVLR